MEKNYFEIFLNGKTLYFSSECSGLAARGKGYLSGRDGFLIYDKTRGLKAEKVGCQLSTNTSTLIPALRILDLPYNPYFDKRAVVESQNNIAFYLKPSALAAFYNRFSTDGLPLEKRKPVIKKAVDFLIKTASRKKFLAGEYLEKLKEPCCFLGFYRGFPIFDANQGMPKLLSRLGIHIGIDEIMVSTPFDKYSRDVYELSSELEKKIGSKGLRKKNRVVFGKSRKLLKELNPRDNSPKVRENKKLRV